MRDYKISKHHLALQESNSRSYVQRRALFHELTIVKYVSRPTRTFLNKDTYIKLRANYKQLKSAEPTAVFIRLFDESFKNYYTNIIQEIERSAAYQTPLQYMHNFTTDIKTCIITTTIALVCVLRFRVIIKRLALRLELSIIEYCLIQAPFKS